MDVLWLNFTISYFRSPWNKFADWYLDQFCSLISAKYNNLIHIYFFLCVIHKYYITQIMKTGLWYNYLVHKPSPLPGSGSFLELDFCDLSSKWRYLGHILAHYSITIKDSPIKLYIFFLVMTRWQKLPPSLLIRLMTINNLGHRASRGERKLHLAFTTQEIYKWYKGQTHNDKLIV